MGDQPPLIAEPQSTETERARPKRNVTAALRENVIRQSPLTRVFGSLVGAQLGCALIGLAFWSIAAQAMTPQEVGVGAALVATMTLLSTFGVLGVGTLLLEHFKTTAVTDRRAMLSTGVGVAVLGGALFSAGWVGLAALVPIPGALGRPSLGTALLLVGATGVAAVCVAFDQAVIGMGASAIQLRRNLLASILRVAFFCGAMELGVRSGQAILASWALALVGSLLATPIRRHLSPRTRVPLRYRWHLARRHSTAAIGHHGLNLAMASSFLILPVVAALILPAVQVAYFSSARLLADTAFAVPFFLTIALFATVDGTDGFRRKAPRTLIVGMALTAGLLVGAVLLGRVVLLMFGTSYSEESLPMLLLLLGAGPALVVKEHFAVLRRLQGRRRQGAVTIGLLTVLELAGAVAGGLTGGMTMFCVGWLTTATVCALMLVPALIAGLRKRPPAKTATEPVRQ